MEFLFISYTEEHLPEFGKDIQAVRMRLCDVRRYKIIIANI